MTAGLIVHGGAGFLKNWSPEVVLSGCRAAVEAGWAHLKQGASALDAVEAAVRALETNPVFNAGYGAVLNREGAVELDALLMDGQRHRIGAVAAVRRIEHPIALARYVMERTPHHLLVGAGAEQFAAAQGIPLVEPKALIAPHRLAQGGDTVGAVALDAAGNLAVAVSTGGVRDKLPGRVGDSAIAGAGGYADNRSGAACATGVGEGIMRALLTFRAVEMLARVANAQAAAEAVMPIFERFDGEGGLILIDQAGGIGIAHNTPFLPTAWITDDQAQIAAQVAGPGHSGS